MNPGLQCSSNVQRTFKHSGIALFSLSKREERKSWPADWRRNNLSLWRNIYFETLEDEPSSMTDNLQTWRSDTASSWGIPLNEDGSEVLKTFESSTIFITVCETFSHSSNRFFGDTPDSGTVFLSVKPSPGLMSTGSTGNTRTISIIPNTLSPLASVNTKDFDELMCLSSSLER